jgi:nucleotide-binding universal stress UspA family protein
VIVVPSGPLGSLDGAIVVAFNGSVRASRALYDLVASGLATGRTTHILSIDREHEVATRVASRAVDFMRFHDLDARPHPLDGTFPASEAVLGAVEQLGATMLVIGAYAHTPVREFFLGSTTRSVMTRAPVPVFCSH